MKEKIKKVKNKTAPKKEAVLTKEEFLKILSGIILYRPSKSFWKGKSKTSE